MKIERNSGAVIFHFLTECICQASEAAHGHAHCQILALNMANAQFCIGINGRPSPNIAPALLLLFNAGIPRLCTDKAPDFIALQPFNLQVPNGNMVILGTGFTNLSQ